MKAPAICRGLIAAALGLLPPLALASPAVEQLLQRADAVRSADPQAFEAALDQLERLVETATPTQRQHLRLLQAYREGYRGRYDLAIDAATALYGETSEAALKFRASLLIANSAAVTRDFSLGLQHIENALALANDQGIGSDWRHQAFVVAAILYNQFGQFALGRDYADRLLAEHPTARIRCIARQLRLEALLGLDDWPTSDVEVEAAIADCAAQDETVFANLVRGYLARHWAAQGDGKKAIALLEAHLAEAEATRYPRLIGEVQALLAEYRLAGGDLAGAERHALGALAQSEGIAYSLPLVAAHKVLYEVALRRDQLATALDHYRQYAEADKARMDDVKAREFAFQVSRHELQQKNQAIELLSKQNEVLSLEQEVAKKEAQNTRLFLALLGVVLVSLLSWAYKIKRVQISFRRLAETDALTGISNRGHFRRQVEAALVRCAGRGEEVGVVVLDLDNFKYINDLHGHAAGDWVLEHVVQACRAHCRKADFFGRLGGEEFAVVSIGCDIAAAERIAAQCRESIEAIDTSPVGSRFVITGSFGCTTTARSGYAYEPLLAHADEAMYRSKRDGRNRVSVYVPAVPSATCEDEATTGAPNAGRGV